MMINLKLSQAYQKCRFIERPNRFLVLCEDADGNEILAHLADSGRLQELLIPGTEIIIEKSDNPNRKTKYTALMVRQNSIWVSINSSIPNKIVRHALAQRQLPGLYGWSMLKQEYSIGRERFDFLLENDEKRFILEVKGVSLVENDLALFPDAVTERGTRHVRHLTQMARQGKATGIYFVVQRDDAKAFAPNRERDPKFQEALAEAIESGVEVWAHSCQVRPGEIIWSKSLPVYKSPIDANV